MVAIDRRRRRALAVVVRRRLRRSIPLAAFIAFLVLSPAGQSATLPADFPPEPPVCTSSSNVNCYRPQPNFTSTPRVVEVGGTITMIVTPDPNYPPGTIWDRMCWIQYPDVYCGATLLHRLGDGKLFWYDGRGSVTDPQPVPHPPDLPTLLPVAGCGPQDLRCAMRVLPPPGAGDDWVPPRSWIGVAGVAGRSAAIRRTRSSAGFSPTPPAARRCSRSSRSGAPGRSRS